LEEGKGPVEKGRGDARRDWGKEGLEGKKKVSTAFY